MIATDQTEFLKAFNFLLEVDGEDVGLAAAELYEDSEHAHLVLKMGVVAGKRRLKLVGAKALRALVSVRSLDRDGGEAERILFAATEIRKYVYGKWDADKNAVLLEELHLVGKVAGTFT